MESILVLPCRHEENLLHSSTLLEIFSILREFTQVAYVSLSTLARLGGYSCIYSLGSQMVSFFTAVERDWRMKQLPTH